MEEDSDRLDSGLLWYPAAIIPKNRMKPKGEYPKKYPEGAVIHFTSGRSRKGYEDALNTHQHGIENGYSYMTVSSDGQVIQGQPLSHWGSHAGASLFNGIKSVSSRFVGIEVCCAGLLTEKIIGNQKQYVSWFGEVYSPEAVRYSSGGKVLTAGWYSKFTEKQEESLLTLVKWLHLNNPQVFKIENVVGHDEVCDPVKRKSDPGFSVDGGMVGFRQRLAKSLNI